VVTALSHLDWFESCRFIRTKKEEAKASSFLKQFDNNDTVS
jgi:hypothetical protein